MCWCGGFGTIWSSLIIKMNFYIKFSSRVFRPRPLMPVLFCMHWFGISVRIFVNYQCFILVHSTSILVTNFSGHSPISLGACLKIKLGLCWWRGRKCKIALVFKTRPFLSSSKAPEFHINSLLRDSFLPAHHFWKMIVATALATAFAFLTLEQNKSGIVFKM